MPVSSKLTSIYCCDKCGATETFSLDLGRSTKDLARSAGWTFSRNVGVLTVYCALCRRRPATKSWSRAPKPETRAKRQEKLEPTRIDLLLAGRQ